MSECTIVPRFDFSNPIPGVGPGQNHTRANVPNNSLAPEKFNEYERIMMELSLAIGDYGFSALIPGASDTVGSAIQKIWEHYYAQIPDLMTRMTTVEETTGNLEIRHTDDITSLATSIDSNYNTLDTAKFNTAGGTITGAVTIARTLTVNDAATLSGLTSSQPIVGNNGLTVNNAVLSATSGLAVTGTGSVSSNLTVGEKLTVNGSGGIEISAGGMRIQQGLTVGAPSSFTGAVDISGRIISYALSIAWAPSRSYIPGDIVMYQNTLYVCTTPHISLDIFAAGNWDYVMTTSSSGTIVEPMIDASFLAEIKTDPVGTVKLYDGTTWEDDKTIPGWYACTGSGGTPDLRDSFIMAGSVDDQGYFDGANAGGEKHTIQLATGQLPSHDHSLHAHTHTVPIDHDHESESYTTASDGEHSHTVACQNPPPNATATAINAHIINNADSASLTQIDTSQDGAHTHTIDIAISGLIQNNTSLGPSETNTGETGSGDTIDITPYYYKMLVIKRMV